MAMLSSLAMQARRVMAAHQAKKDRATGQGEWMAVHPLPVETARVETMPIATGAVCLLMLDPGTDVELQLYFRSTDTARQVGEALVAAAAEAARVHPLARN